MAEEQEKENKPYLKELIAFYFAAQWRSFFTILYLLAFLYFSAFYSGNLLIALRFVIYTVKNSVLILGLNYLFWGVAFIISLVIPFAVSFYAIFLLFEMWRGTWEHQQKTIATVLIIILVPLIIISMDYVIRIVADQPVLRDFVIANSLSISGIKQ
jgi:hypothetical protein